MLVCPICLSPPVPGPSCRCDRLRVSGRKAWFIESKRVSGGWAGLSMSVGDDGVRLWEEYPDGYGDGSSLRELKGDPEEFREKLVGMIISRDVLET